MNDYSAQKIKLIMELRRLGITDTEVLSALERVPREAFIPRPFREHAYENSALPINNGQTISQPYIVAYMTQMLEPNQRHKVLEVGTGSGYQAAVLSKLFRRVYSIERYRSLHLEAMQLFEKLKITNITSKLGDGYKGWEEQAPFKHIIVTAAAEDVPGALVDQLDDNGIMIIPVGPESGDQTILKITKDHHGMMAEEELIPVRFVPLLQGLAVES
ncbi:protein-L-isoaspartate(D-aspartate) O-methyltransferase [Sneathiella sp. P13V-1]|nr:protein-L-isoaspartate(D-aspartate) O-methyltransferase [Sneathiella sp. P13V-1]MBE7637676.1 protein-L-isoaspartate(D-aspartate) O-methyltransferase [Sneathiella sp. P13V-1]